MDLRQIILNDQEARELAELGAANACAERCRKIAPKIFKEFLVTERTIVAIYNDPMLAERVLTKIESAAQNNPLINRMVKWLGVGSTGIDVGNEKTRRILMTPIENGGVGLNDDETRELFEAAMVEPNISGIDVTNILPL